MTPKELTALAKACRKAGITHFKNAEIEFTLGAEEAKSSKKAKQTGELEADKPDQEGPTQNELLFWSSGGTNFDEAESN